MYKIFLLAITLSACITATAQVPEDAIRYSFYPQNGTARNLAIGGANGSLGGDLNSLFVNPAGLGFYKTGELAFTPGFFMNNNKIGYRGTNSSSKANNFSVGITGIVYGEPVSKKSSHAVSLGFTQSANFNNTVHYTGLNNYSSFAEQWAEEVAKSGKTIDQVLNDQQYAYGSAPALYTYLVDTVRVNGLLQVKAAPEFILDAGQAIRQEMTRTTKGGLYELAIGYAYNKGDKWYFGASVGMPIVILNSETVFSESDTSNNTSNHFKNFTYTDQYKSIGVGFNGRLGIIYRPQDYIRLGLSVQTPSFLGLTDTRSSSVTASLENPVYNATAGSAIFNGSEKGKAKFNQMTPWRAILSASYVFREVENTKRQRAFITADVEYVNHRGSRFSSANEEPAEDEKDYYKALNKVVKAYYKGNFNFRVGGELKFHVVMARLGFAYYSNPYKDAELKSSKMLLSGGLGYRNKGIFLDLTYVYGINKEASFPYRLEDRANTFASEKNNRGNIVATLGFKF